MGYRISGRLELHVIRELDRVQHGMHISRLGKHMVQQSSKLFRRRAFGVGNLFNHEEPRRATYRGKVIIKLRGGIRRRAGQHLHHSEGDASFLCKRYGSHGPCEAAASTSRAVRRFVVTVNIGPWQVIEGDFFPLRDGPALKLSHGPRVSPFKSESRSSRSSSS